MDFYQQQQTARCSSRLLILLYLAGVVALGILSSLWLSLLLIPLKLLFAAPTRDLFSLPQFLFLSGLIMLLCLIISYARYHSLKRGGWHVAKALGASRLALTANSLKDQQFRNVVEEMALASGLPVPALFVQEQEQGINSFAAGMGIQDAVIVVTRGALEALDRDELQAMVAHEFSHIRHGDIRLNLQLAAAMTGLLVIAELAEQLDRPMQHQTTDQYWPEKPRRHASPLHSGCYLIGYGGVFFSELIKAAVNRQRETLADAAAVQFTRNPRALASALKKVAGHPYASLIFHPASRSFSHLFFAQGLDSTFAGALATHPPLAERIRALEPDWNGQYIRNLLPMQPSDYREQADTPVQQRRGSALDGSPSSRIQPAPPAAMTLDLDAPQEWLPQIPAPLITAAHQVQGAQSVLYSLLISSDLVIRHRQFSLLPNPREVEALTCYPLSAPLRLGLVELCLPTLQRLDSQQYAMFTDRLHQLIHADGEENLFEWLLSRLIEHQLAPCFSRIPPSNSMVRNIEQLGAEIQQVASWMVLHCTNTPAAAEAFFTALSAQLPLPLRRVTTVDLDIMGNALARLQQAAPRIKLQFIHALSDAMAWDGKVSDVELTLFRVLALCLDCPVPPPPPGQGAAIVPH